MKSVQRTHITGKIGKEMIFSTSYEICRFSNMENHTITLLSINIIYYKANNSFYSSNILEKSIT